MFPFPPEDSIEPPRETPPPPEWRVERSLRALDVQFQKACNAEGLAAALSDLAYVLGVSTGDYGVYKTVVHLDPSADGADVQDVVNRVQAYRPEEEREAPPQLPPPLSIEERIERLPDPELRGILRELQRELEEIRRIIGKDGGAELPSKLG